MSNDRPTVPSVSSAQMASTTLESGHRRNLSAFGTRAQASISRPDMLHGATNGSNGNGNASQQVPVSPSSCSSSHPANSPQALRRDGKKFIGCSPFEDYELTTKLGEGTFGEVHKAVHKATGATVALKRVLMHNEKEGLPITAIREIKLLKSLNHPNVVPLSDMLVKHEAHVSGASPSVYMVFPYMEHDLTGLLENPKIHLRPEHIKLYLRQLLEGTAYLHASRVMHRDMKASNLLINNEGQLFIADFGLARTFIPGDNKDMTKCVVTRWYRPPELLLGERKYTTAIDMWGVGCILAEMLVGKPVFQGSTDLNQIEQIMRVCGSPNDVLWPGWRDLPDCKQVEDFNFYPRRVRDEFMRFGEEAVDLLDQLLQLDPRRRPDAATALKHKLFYTSPFPSRPEDMPKFEHSHELDRRKSRHQQRAQKQQQQQQQPPHAPMHNQEFQSSRPGQNHHASSSINGYDRHSGDHYYQPPLPLPPPQQQHNHQQSYSNQHQSQYSPVHRRDSSRPRYSRRDGSYDDRSRRNNDRYANEPRYGDGGDGRRGTPSTGRNNGYHPYQRNNNNGNRYGGNGESGWR
ncbi:serine/threonine protein kinase, CMGC, CDC2/CDK sub [Coemansia sp. RSA 1804]|nr:serine/threonine protein kinase, CMGC, CDC2/CDK sub [Coemansia sp. RSA 1804]